MKTVGWTKTSSTALTGHSQVVNLVASSQCLTGLIQG